MLFNRFSIRTKQPSSLLTAIFAPLSVRNLLEHAAARFDDEEIIDARAEKTEPGKEQKDRADRRCLNQKSDDDRRDDRRDPEPRAANAGAKRAHPRRIDFGHVDVKAGNDPAE